MGETTEQQQCRGWFCPAHKRHPVRAAILLGLLLCITACGYLPPDNSAQSNRAQSNTGQSHVTHSDLTQRSSLQRFSPQLFSSQPSAAEARVQPVPIPNQRPPDGMTMTRAARKVVTPVPLAAPIARAEGLPTRTLSPGQPAASHRISTVIGYSGGSLPLTAYHFGNGPQRVVLIGGIHGGTEWNTVLLAHAIIDYFTAHPAAIPAGLTVQVIPVANPDGLFLVTQKSGRFAAADVKNQTSAGRFNRNGVDLNRNWGCNWAATAWWGAVETSGGDAPFSEIETQLLRNFLLQEPKPATVLFWHSAAPGVFAGGCNGIDSAAEKVAAIYAAAARYPHGAAFTQYPITGDATNWLSTQQIPAFVVELASTTDLEWSQNLAGVQALLQQLSNSAVTITPVTINPFPS